MKSINKNKKDELIKSQFETSDCSIFTTHSISSDASKESAKTKKSSSGDRKLAQSAQMFHYQLQKQQIIDLEKYF